MSSKPDYPFYDGHPAAISPFGWLTVVGSVVVAFLLLILLPFATTPLNFIPAIVFVALPLTALAIVSGGHQWALFRPVGIKGIALMLALGISTVVASFAAGYVLVQIFPMTPNAAAGLVATLDGPGTALFLARTAIQLVGEELMTILPLLAVLWFCVTRLGLSRGIGLVIAVIVSTLWFAAAHLPTYGWNFVQCFGVIGTARLILTAAFLLTRNLWVSAGAHIVNDWSEFFLPTLLEVAVGHSPIQPGG